MNTLALPTQGASMARDALARAWHVWRGTTPRQWSWVLTVALVVTLVALPQRIEMVQRLGWHPLQGTVEFLFPLYVSVLMFLGWSLADAGTEEDKARRARLLVALFGTAAVTAVTAVAIWQQVGGPEVWAAYAARHGKAQRSLVLMLLAEYVNIVIVSGMVYAVVEVFRRRRLTQRALQATIGAQAALEQQVLESRLAAMQAQVEPRFLFDALVDIQALYERDAQQGAAHLDRLTSYLRAALPRLRESGSTVGAELELVRAYLDVVTSVHGGQPQLTIVADDACRSRRLHPMLLLPLVQRAVRAPSGALPPTMAIDARCEGAATIVTLRIPCSGGCTDDAELTRVRERLLGLYGTAAQLECVESDGASTELTLRVPAGNGAVT